MARYPCEECLVDTMCTEICYKLIFYSDYLNTYIPDFLVSTENRMNRLRTCILKYGGPSERVVKLDNYIIGRWNGLERERR
jgi:hypothetical protein